MPAARPEGSLFAGPGCLSYCVRKLHSPAEEEEDHEKIKQKTKKMKKKKGEEKEKKKEKETKKKQMKRNEVATRERDT